MADGKSFKNIALARIKSARSLIQKNDWDGAAQMMGLALESALKATVCKTLRIPEYPEKTHRDKKVSEFFMTHNFDRLLLISGLSNIFESKQDPDAFKNWSSFTIQYPGEWTNMRYNDPQTSQFNKTLTEDLYRYLYADDRSIIKMIIIKRRW